MSDDVDGFIATAPRLEFTFAIKARIGPIQDLGQTARGHRRIIDILGGEVQARSFLARSCPAARTGTRPRGHRLSSSSVGSPSPFA
jgi:hypothetical protein